MKLFWPGDTTNHGLLLHEYHMKGGWWWVRLPRIGFETIRHEDDMRIVAMKKKGEAHDAI